MPDNKPTGSPADQTPRRHESITRAYRKIATHLKNNSRIWLIALSAIWLAATANTLATAEETKPSAITSTAAASAPHVASPATETVSANGTAAANTPEKISNSDCLSCHLDASTTREVNGKTESLIFPTAAFEKSVHSKLSCMDCHTDVKDLVHDPLGPPDCVHCHEKQGKACEASVHGKANGLIKTGTASPTTSTASADPTKRPAQCWDCHSSHDIQITTAPTSPLYFASQAQTCGKCHVQEALDMNFSVHGKAMALGKREAPTCTDCHIEGGHNFKSLKDGSALKISETCSRCHASVYLDKKYDLPTDRVKTYMESYHGLAAQYGSKTVANCASCHSFHKVLPSSDPASSISPDNLVMTCGKCHVGADKMFVSGKIHEDIATGTARDLGSQISRWVRRIYLILIVGVIGAMFVHNALLFRKKVAAHLAASGKRNVMRMSTSHRWQHAILAISFIVLALTGFALKFPDSWLAGMFGSSEPVRRLIHRIAAVIMMVGCVYHVIHVIFTKEGRQLIKDFFPTKKDICDIIGTARYLVGLSTDKPKIGRFGYAEKMEYWAVIWGSIIMGVTGLMVWFKIDVTRFMPRWIVDVALTIHYYEAVLACLAIVVWHFYHVIFDPDVYPLNTSCWDGRVSEEWQKHEHPLDTQSPRIDAGKPGTKKDSDNETKH